MKVLIIFAFILVTNADVVLRKSTLKNGGSTVHHSQDTLGNYAFGYDENHGSGGTFHKEHGDDSGNKFGSYGLIDADGRRRIVTYVADYRGFRVKIHSNEPGVESAASAGVSIHKTDMVAGIPEFTVPETTAFHRTNFGVALGAVSYKSSVAHGPSPSLKPW